VGPHIVMCAGSAGLRELADTELHPLASQAEHELADTELHPLASQASVSRPGSSHQCHFCSAPGVLPLQRLRVACVRIHHNVTCRCSWTRWHPQVAVLILWKKRCERWAIRQGVVVQPPLLLCIVAVQADEGTQQWGPGCRVCPLQPMHLVNLFC
jgi:hypothetical protein